MAIGLWTACCVAGRYHNSPSEEVECGNCGKKNPTMVTVPSFNPPLEVELVIRRWKDNDAGIDDVFNAIEKFATEDFFNFMGKIRPRPHPGLNNDLGGENAPMPSPDLGEGKEK